MGVGRHRQENVILEFVACCRWPLEKGRRLGRSAEIPESGSRDGRARWSSWKGDAAHQCRRLGMLLLRQKKRVEKRNWKGQRGAPGEIRHMINGLGVLTLGVPWCFGTMTWGYLSEGRGSPIVADITKVYSVIMLET